MNNELPEAQVNPQIQQQVTPDVVSPQGKQNLFNNLANTIQKKKFLDFIIKGIGDKAGAAFTSRVKDPQTVVQKIATKRAAGRDYNLDDVNDTYGARLVTPDSSAQKNIKGMMKKASDLGVFKINKSEDVTKDTYHAHHIDIQTPDGVKGEVQIMDPQQELEATANHSLRSMFGEKPPEQVAKLRDMQANIASKTEDGDAHNKAQQIQEVAKKVGNIVDPRIVASILQKPANRVANKRRVS